MKVLITGAGGLIGSEAAKHYLTKGDDVVGIDNNSRMKFFGQQGDVTKVIKELSSNKNYMHVNCNITNRDVITGWIKAESPDVIIHAAAQPSHDKAASIPFDDFDTNAVGTFNMLEGFRRLDSKSAVFIHMSTNKVYGDAPNYESLEETDKRYDFHKNGRWFDGINETMSIDQTTHSLFGSSKLSADIAAQEYGRYFDLNVGIFRGGCLTGPQHAGVELHGFLSYIIKCAKENKKYTIFGYKGKQVRDQIHCKDVISAFDAFIQNPHQGEVYNLGGCKENSASIIEVIEKIEKITNRKFEFEYSEKNRIGDHICYYSDMSKFKKHYPHWKINITLDDIIEEMMR